MKRLISLIFCVVITAVCCISTSAAEYNSTAFWSGVKKYEIVNDSGCRITNGSYSYKYQNQKQTASPYIAFRFDISDSGKFSERLVPPVGIKIKFISPDNAVYDSFNISANMKSGTIAGKNGTLDYDCSAFRAFNSGGTYLIMINYRDLSASVTDDTFTVYFFATDSYGMFNTVNSPDEVRVPRLSVITREEAEKTAKKSGNGKTAKQKSGTSSPEGKKTGSKLKSASSGKGSSSQNSAKQKYSGVETTQASAAGVDVTEYEKARINSADNAEGDAPTEMSGLQIAALCVGFVSLGAAAAVVISVMANKHRTNKLTKETKTDERVGSQNG